jgi:amidohydrolase
MDTITGSLGRPHSSPSNRDARSTDWWRRVPASLTADVVAWRRQLHATPELGFAEHETSAMLRSIVAQPGVTVETPLATGLVAKIKGRYPGPRIAVRVDIDGLPVVEETGLPFASRRHGFMHACGHDAHMAVGLGVATFLAGVADQLSGEVHVLFQPAEELADGGAKALLAAGAFDGVDAVLGFHIWSGHPVGIVQVQPGAIMASTDEFHITVHGRGGHAAAPHLSVDPVVAAAAIVGQLQTIVSRRLDPFDPAVVTVASIHGGSAFNVIPEEVALVGTVRTLRSTVRSEIHSQLDRIVTETARAMGADARCNIVPGVPAVLNDPDLAALMRQGVAEVLGTDHVLVAPPQMGGDDFGFIAEQIPSCYPLIGAGSQASGSIYPHHHPRFNIDEASLDIALRVLLHGLQRLTETVDKDSSHSGNHTTEALG